MNGECIQWGSECELGMVGVQTCIYLAFDQVKRNLVDFSQSQALAFLFSFSSRKVVEIICAGYGQRSV